MPTKPRRWILAATAVVSTGLAAGAFASCTQSHAPLGGTCALNSDCDSPLVCVFGQCHTACMSSRDCPAGAQCILGTNGFDVCQTPAEAACRTSADCHGGETCGAGGVCRDACQSASDCPSFQACVAATCVDVAPADAGPVDAAAAADAADAADAGSDDASNPDADADAGCGDLATDVDNCGACGHVCLDGPCTAGLCAPLLIASGVDKPATLVAYDINFDQVMWSTASGQVQSNGWLGGTTPTVPVAGQKHIVSLAFTINSNSVILLWGDDVAHTLSYILLTTEGTIDVFTAVGNPASVAMNAVGVSGRISWRPP